MEYVTGWRQATAKLVPEQPSNRATESFRFLLTASCWYHNYDGNIRCVPSELWPPSHTPEPDFCNVHTFKNNSITSKVMSAKQHSHHGAKNSTIQTLSLFRTSFSKFVVVKSTTSESVSYKASAARKKQAATISVWNATIVEIIRGSFRIRELSGLYSVPTENWQNFKKGSKAIRGNLEIFTCT